MKTLSAQATIVENKDSSYQRRLLTSLYDKYSPGAYGFFIAQTHCRELSEELLIKVFLNVWAEITTLKENEEKKIVVIILCVFRKWCQLNQKQSGY